MRESLVKFEIGFAGGGSVAGTCDAAELRALEDAVTGGRDDAVALDTDGSRLVVRPAQVAWLRTAQRESRVGF